MVSIFLSLFLANVLIIPEGSSTAQPASPAASEQQSEAASADAGVGTVVQLKGKAEAVTFSGERRELAEGDPLYQNETVETSAGSTLQIELNDESIYTLSEKTSIRVDDFAYDESAKDGTLATSVSKGVFRFISGKIAKVKPEKVNIDIPSGTIGIRGTIVVGEIKGEECLVGLETEEGDTAKHRIVVSNNAGGKTQEVEITQPGFATTIAGRGQAPKPVFQIPAEQRSRFQQTLPPKPQFAQGTQPGDPNRYAKLFDTGKMKERQQAMREKAQERQDGKAKREGREDRAQGGISDDQNKKIKGPNGPDNPDGSQPPQRFGNQDGSSGDVKADRLQRSGEKKRQENDTSRQGFGNKDTFAGSSGSAERSSFEKPKGSSQGFHGSGGERSGFSKPFGENSPKMFNEGASGFSSAGSKEQTQGQGFQRPVFGQPFQPDSSPQGFGGTQKSSSFSGAQFGGSRSQGGFGGGSGLGPGSPQQGPGGGAQAPSRPAGGGPPPGGRK